MSFRPCDQKKALHELQHCLDDIHSWLRENRPLLNGNNNKDDYLWEETKVDSGDKHPCHRRWLISPDATTKNLGIVYDSTLSMEHQVNAVRPMSRSVDNISRIRRFLTQDATKGPATRNDIVDDIVDDPSSTMVFNVAKIASARASSTISLAKSLRVAGPLDSDSILCHIEAGLRERVVIWSFYKLTSQATTGAKYGS